MIDKKLINELKTETQRIMALLTIEVRKNHVKDGELTTQLKPSIQNMGAFHRILSDKVRCIKQRKS